MTKRLKTDRRTVLKTIGGGVIGSAALSGTVTAGGGNGRGKGPRSVLEIKTDHDHDSGDHLFDLSTHDIPQGWNTVVLDNQTGHTHFAYTVKLPQQAIDDAKEMGMDLLELYYESVTRPFQFFWDSAVPGKDPDGDDNTDVYDSIFPPWFGDVLFYGGPGLTSGRLDSMTTVSFDPGDYIVECYVKEPNEDFHSYHGMLDHFSVGEGESRAAEPESTVELDLSRSGIDFPESIRPGRHTVAVNFEDQQQYANLVGHDVHLIRLDETGDTDELNDWMNWATVGEFISDGNEPEPFMGGVTDIWTAPPDDVQGTGYFHVGLGAGDYAWVAEVPDPEAKGLLETFSVTP